MAKKFKRAEISKKVLRLLYSASKITKLILDRPEIYKVMRAYNYGDQEKVRQTLRKLKTNKLIKMYERKGDEVIEISPFGIKRSLKFDYDDLVITNKRRRWDGRWRIVIFDIPEKKKRIRDSINIKLKELGFKPMQKSTFIYPYECRREIEFIKSHFLLKDEVSYILAEEIDQEDIYQRLFHL